MKTEGIKSIWVELDPSIYGDNLIAAILEAQFPTNGNEKQDVQATLPLDAKRRRALRRTPRCKSVNVDGNQCAQTTRNPTGLCQYHTNNDSRRCEALTALGRSCGRFKTGGSAYCRIHT